MIRAWLALAAVFVVFWTAILWGTAHLIARLLDA